MMTTTQRYNPLSQTFPIIFHQTIIQMAENSKPDEDNYFQRLQNRSSIIDHPFYMP